MNTADIVARGLITSLVLVTAGAGLIGRESVRYFTRRASSRQFASSALIGLGSIGAGATEMIGRPVLSLATVAPLALLMAGLFLKLRNLPAKDQERR